MTSEILFNWRTFAGARFAERSTGLTVVSARHIEAEILDWRLFGRGFQPRRVTETNIVEKNKQPKFITIVIPHEIFIFFLYITLIMSLPISKIN